MTDTNGRIAADETVELTLNGREVYLLHGAIERALDNDDSSYERFVTELADLFGRLPEVDLTWDEFNADPEPEEEPEPEDEYIAFVGLNEDGEPALVTALPNTPELSAYLFTQKRRRCDTPLLDVIAPLVRGSEVTDAYPGTDAYREAVRESLNINTNGKRYRGDWRSLQADKAERLARIAPVVKGDSLNIVSRVTFDLPVPAPVVAPAPTPTSGYGYDMGGHDGTNVDW